MNPSFRAWDKLNNEMYVVEQINFDCGEFESIGYGITNLRGADEIELMQSTGLCDKEGTEVFEGDILHHQIQTEYTFIVKYDKERQQLIIKNFQKSMSTIIRISDIKRIRLVPNTIREAQKRNSNLK